MSTLSNKSKLYKKLDEMYQKKESGDISEKFFNEYIDTALEYSKREIQFVLFNLKLLNEDVDSGNETVNSILNRLLKLLDALTGKNLKRAFFVNVLEIALDEK